MNRRFGGFFLYGMMKKILLFVFVLLVVRSSGVAQDSTVTVCFGGDVTFANHFEWYVGKRYRYPFRKLKCIRKTDLIMVNLENPLTTKGAARKKVFVFRARPDYVKVLLNGGIDIVNLANNHIYDYSEQGLLETIRYLDEAGIAHVGAGANLDQARKPVIRKVRGLRIGFLGYYGLRPHSDCHPATADSAGTVMRILSYIRKDVHLLRPKVDFVVVNFHWGYEKENYPREDQIFVAHKTIDYGADLVIGHHPHVWQGIERYKGGIIAYSLGNFIFGGNSRTYEQSALLKVRFAKSKNKKMDARVVPIEINHWQSRLLTGADSVHMINQIKKYSEIFKQSIF